MKQYENWLDWGDGDSDDFPRWINNNEAIPWSIELIETFKDKWQWEMLSQNEIIANNNAIVKHFKDKLDLELIEHTRKHPESDDCEIKEELPNPWCIYYKFTVDDYIKVRNINTPNDFFRLSKNEDVIWDIETLFKLEDKLNWDCLSENTALPWDKQLVSFFEDRWLWGTNNSQNEYPLPCKGICTNEAIVWDLEMIEKYADKINWPELSHNCNVEWSLELVDKYTDKVDWYGIARQKEKIWDKYFAEHLNDDIVEEIYRAVLG